jgi:protein phosphatase inhibitor 2
MTVHTPPHSASGSPPKRPKGRSSPASAYLHPSREFWTPQIVVLEVLESLNISSLCFSHCSNIPSANIIPGILKNRSTSNINAVPPPIPSPEIVTTERPAVDREMSERDIVLANTLHNAGGHRRSPSAPRGLASRRHSGNGADDADENNQRLKWDEANLYLTEQDRGTHMKITEPKTPYAKQYDPTEDEEDLTRLHAEDLLVDEVDKKHAIESGELRAHKANRTRDDEIPGLDIGEPEVDTAMEDVPTPDSEKRVMVDADDADDVGYHGEQMPENMTEAELEKHLRFEQMRKKHYEMKNIKNLLG